MIASGSDDQTRVGNPERERAIALLNNALTEGYLEIHEFDERTSVVYAAKTRSELRGVLAHLPGDGRLFPDSPSAAQPGASLEAPLPVELGISWTTVTRKGTWQVPARILVSGSMGTADLDFSGAEFTHGVVDIELQTVSTRTPGHPRHHRLRSERCRTRRVLRSGQYSGRPPVLRHRRALIAGG